MVFARDATGVVEKTCREYTNNSKRADLSSQDDTLPQLTQLDKSVEYCADMLALTDLIARKNAEERDHA